MSRSDAPAACEVAAPMPPRAPALGPAVAFAAGILVDRQSPEPLSTWAAAAALALVAAAALSRIERRTATFALLAAFGALGAARHHLFGSNAAADDIRHFAADERQLVRLRGSLASSPSVRSPPEGTLQAAWTQIERTACLLDCRAIETADGWRSVSGRARLTVAGRLAVEHGDQIEITGWLARPLPPDNPGQFDFGEFLRRQGASCVVSADHPDAVRRIAEGSIAPGRLFAKLRARGEALFRQRLGRENAALASALLLGERGGLTSDVRDAFARSGMMHILAISGLNVAILAALVWPICRLARASPRATAIAISAIVVGYACVADGAPPVTRAAVLVVIAAAGLPWHRRVAVANSLALAALGMLAWRPADLFDAGARLSFLAVAGMVWLAGVRRRIAARVSDNPLPSPERGPLGTIVALAGRAVADGYLLVAAVWLFTLPLVMHQFHLVSPIGLFANVALIPVVFVTLWLGYLMLAVGLVWSPASLVFASGFDLGLSVLSAVVHGAASVRYGHFTVPGPSTAWVVGYYLLLAALLPAARDLRWLRWAGYPLAAWCALGLSLGLRAAPIEGLRCTILSVGHGLSVLVETPSGGTLLYDAGSIQDATRARRAVEGVMQSRRRLRLDAIVISHADIDHFNGVPGLVESVPVGTVLVAPSFLDFEQAAVVACCEAAYRSGVPIRLLDAGDRLALDPEVQITALQPQRGERLGSDNAHSVVLLVEYAGRRILLTGDLEKEGLSRLLSLPPLDVDVMLAPHHGSLAANPESLARWGTPEHVVASADRRANLAELERRFGPTARVYNTGEHGAVTVAISPDGRVTVSAARAAGASARIRESPRHDSDTAASGLNALSSDPFATGPSTRTSPRTAGLSDAARAARGRGPARSAH